ncbi:bifunctional folylpolyglutamate synthase/dihydrofolate synthase [Thermodesulfobacteriota bacterium]
MVSAYEDAIRFLESFIDYEKIGGAYYTDKREELASIKALLKRLGNPERGMKYVHIAGTKGKGSTAVMTASIFTEAGLKTGLYTSPHLIDFRERIRIDGQMISKEDTVTHVEELADAAIAVRNDPTVGELSFFEVYTALAFLHFRMLGCDMVLLETGLGGRLDATNIIIPRACAITLIGHDHEYILGDTLENIAIEKAGILKPGVPAVMAPQPPEAEEAINREARRIGVPIYRLIEGHHRVATENQITYQMLETGKGKTAFSLEGIFGVHHHLESPLLGRHQITNAATAVTIAELIAKEYFELSSDIISAGLRKIEWPGRFQIVCQEPTIVLDGAHNPESAILLYDTIQEQIQYDRLTIVFGGMGDHNLRAVAEVLFPVADYVIMTKSQNPRAATPETLVESSADLCKRYGKAPTTAEALHMAKQYAGSRDAILVTGSLYVVGEALVSLKPELRSSKGDLL